ncbi:GGDEF domain-containing protein [Paenibacillus sp. GCM10023252]|uniref:GGDEF domain-containing protein n=1 Tax=Paenibacillus sp. GCM10023252 TaxID=3252649 RepID=UPI00360AA42A
MLRWFFLAASGVIYGVYYYSEASLPWFLLLFAFGTAYMGAAELALRRSEVDSKRYYYLTRGGVLFDYVAWIGLLALTGGTSSPMFPIGFLIILHAAVYWGLLGGMVTSVLLGAAYAGLLMTIDPQPVLERAAYHVMNVIFLILIGWLGGIIVARERRHRDEKSFYENMAKRDYLTGLPNHRTFQEHMKDRMDTQQPLTLVMADIDHFKLVNDRFGHVTGDLVLRQIGRLLEQSIPKATGTAFRYGGEEFALLLYTSDKDQVEQLLSRLRVEICALCFEAKDKDETFQVTMSFGAVARSAAGQSADLVSAADSVLYEAKQQGRNRFVWGLHG